MGWNTFYMNKKVKKIRPHFHWSYSCWLIWFQGRNRPFWVCGPHFKVRIHRPEFSRPLNPSSLAPPTLVTVEVKDLQWWPWWYYGSLAPNAERFKKSESKKCITYWPAGFPAGKNTWQYWCQIQICQIWLQRSFGLWGCPTNRTCPINICCQWH